MTVVGSDQIRIYRTICTTLDRANLVRQNVLVGEFYGEDERFQSQTENLGRYHTHAKGLLEFKKITRLRSFSTESHKNMGLYVEKDRVHEDLLLCFSGGIVRCSKFTFLKRLL